MGNITQSDGKSYIYAPDQRIASVKQGSTAIAVYNYGSQGQRMAKTTSTGTTNFDYDPQGRLLNENGPSLAANYVYLDGEPLARVDYNLSDTTGNVANWNIAYYHNNQIGAPVKTTDRLGNVSWTGQLDPFGKVLSINPNITQNLRSPGQYFDIETGLFYNMNRYYDPNTGRYLQSDPIGLLGGINSYTYVLNNPLRWVDPFGLEPFVNYPNSNTAGEQAIRDINPTSIKNGVEYAGRLCSYTYVAQGGCFYTPPNKGGKDWSYDGVCPYGTSPQGNYHTHGNYDPRYFNEAFSPEDKANLDKDKQTGYLGTPNGIIKSYTPDPNVPLGGQIQVIGNGAK